MPADSPLSTVWPRPAQLPPPLRAPAGACKSNLWCSGRKTAPERIPLCHSNTRRPCIHILVLFDPCMEASHKRARFWTKTENIHVCVSLSTRSDPTCIGPQARVTSSKVSKSPKTNGACNGRSPPVATQHLNRIKAPLQGNKRLQLR